MRVIWINEIACYICIMFLYLKLRGDNLDRLIWFQNNSVDRRLCTMGLDT